MCKKFLNSKNQNNDNREDLLDFAPCDDYFYFFFYSAVYVVQDFYLGGGGGRRGELLVGSFYRITLGRYIISALQTEMQRMECLPAMVCWTQAPSVNFLFNLEKKFIFFSKLQWWHDFIPSLLQFPLDIWKPPGGGSSYYNFYFFHYYFFKCTLKDTLTAKMVMFCHQHPKWDQDP